MASKQKSDGVFHDKKFNLDFKNLIGFNLAPQ